MSTETPPRPIAGRRSGDPEPTPALAALSVLFPRSGRPRNLGQLEQLFRDGAQAARDGLVDHSAAGTDRATALADQAAARAAIRDRALRGAIPDGPPRVALAGLAAVRDKGIRAKRPSTGPDEHLAADFLQQWLDDPDAIGLILAGKTGTGKTVSAYATAAETVLTGAMTRTRTGPPVRRQLVVRACTVAGYLDALRPEGSPEPVWRVRDDAMNAELLVLDAVGDGTDGPYSEFVRDKLLELINYRNLRRLRTIYTTNDPPVDYTDPKTNVTQVGLPNKVGNRVWSRMGEAATGIRFVGTDLRMTTPLTW